MPKDPRIKKVLVIGSGPIIIGQAAEFDYSGTQACRALKSEGIETVLVNSNPATIMTDPDIADHVYIEPLTAEVVERIIEKEKPDAILPNLGGQMGLNLSMELARSGFLDRSGVRLLDGELQRIYGADVVHERHSNRYEVDPAYVTDLERKGLHLAGVSVEAGYPEAFEMEGHPFYIAVVYHPEYISRPGKPHPLFVQLVKRGLERAHA